MVLRPGNIQQMTRDPKADSSGAQGPTELGGLWTWVLPGPISHQSSARWLHCASPGTNEGGQWKDKKRKLRVVVGG